MARDVLSDNFVNLCIDPSLNFADGTCRVLVEGQYFDPAEGCVVVPNTIIRVLSTRDIDCQFGAGSVLAEMLKTAFCQCPAGSEFYALPREDAALGVAAEYELTITGPATSPGRFTLYAGNDRYNIDIPIATGDTATDIAAAVAAAVSDEFPYTAIAALGVITFTAKNAGTIGNYLNMVYNWAGRANYAPAGVTVAMVQTVVGSVNPVTSQEEYKSIIGECCYSCYALGSDDLDWQTALRDHIRDAWSCDKPQCFGHGYVFNSGSLGEILATGDNSAELSRLAHCETDVVFPYLKVAAFAALSCCTACTNPELSIQGPNYGLLSCILQPQSCDACFEYDELVQLQEQAFVVSGPANIGSGALTSPYIFNDVTNWLFDSQGRPNATFRDANSRRLTTAAALSLAEKLQEFNGLGLFTKNTDIKRGILGTNPRLMLASIRAWAKNNIGVLFSEFDDINKDITLQTDFEVAPKCAGNPNVLWLNFRYRPPVRVGKVNVNMQPALLDNCDR